MLGARTCTMTGTQPDSIACRRRLPAGRTGRSGAPRRNIRHGDARQDREHSADRRPSARTAALRKHHSGQHTPRWPAQPPRQLAGARFQQQTHPSRACREGRAHGGRARVTAGEQCRGHQPQRPPCASSPWLQGAPPAGCAALRSRRQHAPSAPPTGLTRTAPGRT